MMDFGAILQIISSLDLEPSSRQALLRAARGESGEEVEAAIETLARSLGVIGGDGEVKEDTTRELMEEFGLEMENLTESPEP
jgi:hypothetical protein